MNKQLILVALLGCMGVALGGFISFKQFKEQSAESQRGHLTDIQLIDTNKEVRKGSEWLGKIVVINHWATWCPPCREEIPMLIQYQNDLSSRGVQVIGIAHDQLEATQIFGDQIGINYPSLIAINEGAALLADHGNENAGALPHTAIFDQQGNLVHSWLGKINYQQLHHLVEPLLAQ